MCGIAGYVSFTSKKTSSELVRKMIDVLEHRGPDGEGIFEADNVCLGHKRLSIIDVEGSRQPLSNEDGMIWVTFNGEIYNYQELRKELISKGHVLKTHGDTETLVHLYEEYGHNMVDRLIGMFAFAIWDAKKKGLFLARDRIGIKPLYYAPARDGFYFASESKSILQVPGINASVNQKVLGQYLTYRSVGAPDTLFEGIFKLRPGYSITVNASECNVRQYWDIPLVEKRKKQLAGTKSLQDIQGQVEQRLITSVKRRLISDVPLGAFLSGGVDSSLIVALMSKITNIPVKTYSVGFENFCSSELPYAKIVAQQYQTDHHELVLQETVFSDYLRHLTWIRDAPLSEPADVPLFLLSKMARQDVKVLLSGEGSDEIFGGYPKYAYDRFAEWLRCVPASWMDAVGGVLPEKFRRVETALRSLRIHSREDRWAQWFSPFTVDQKRQLLKIEGVLDNPTQEYVAKTKGCEDIDAMLYTDCKLWLPENLLDRGDRMTMGASVEGRVPFLDHELVEYVFSIPAGFKVNGMKRKWLIKKIAEKYLPRKIIYRKKVGFAVPLDQWFRGQLKELCYDSICNNHSLPEAIFSKKFLRQLLDDHCSLKKNNFLPIWTLLGLSLWWDIFVNNGSRS
jgi:asparagine synthase (glutamine-hydrolysing)